MKLEQLLNGIHVAGSFPSSAAAERVVCNSTEAGPDAVFFAVKGFKMDGNSFVRDAAARGARVIVSESSHDLADVTCLRVEDAREAMAIMSNNLYGRPTEKLFTVGVTGTSGKTTTSYLLDSIFRGKKGKSTIIGTIRHLVHGSAKESHNTTPESFDLNAYLREALDAGAGHAIMEVSSHALKLKRVHGMVFSAAVFTNLTRDHMDFHPTLDDYLKSKVILFKDLLSEEGAGAVNADDPASGAFLKGCAGRPLLYGLNAEKLDVRADSVEYGPAGTRLRISTPAGPLALEAKLRGPFNVYNILAAVTAGVGAGLPLEQITEGVERLAGVDGRFESIDLGQPFAVIVDYAHKPDALEKVLKAAREITRGKLTCVFGCGGDRDRGKRPLMGAISETMADRTLVTSDNPRTEEPWSIIAEITAGMKDKKRFEVVQDREKAIALAIADAGPGDTVVIAGKGHEDYQIVGTVKHHFDDRETAAKYLKLKGNNGSAA